MTARPAHLASLAAAALALAATPTAHAIPQAPHDAAHGISCTDCHIPYAGLNEPADAAGAATAGDALSLTDDGKAWSDGAWIGGVLTVTSGASAGQFRKIVASTATTVTWETPLATPIAVGDAYQLGRTTYDDVEERCATCHNPTGVAPSAGPFASHRGRGAIIRCGKCHDPHNVEGIGQALLRETMRSPNAVTPTVYPGGDNPLVAGAPSFNGVCESCHTVTAHHRNDAAADHAHGLAQDCTSCHTHARGFTLDCLDCHAVAQDNGDGIPVGGRRPVTAEFPVNDAHAHFGGALDNSDCAVCHDLSAHQSGEVVLVDPDDSAVTYTFLRWADLSADPDVSDFCAHCHDADGAQRMTRPFDPFGDGRPAPDVASKFAGTLRWSEWSGDICFGTEGTQRIVNSHHDISASDQAASGARVECLSCHGAHTASATQPLGDPDDDAAPWTGTVSDLCLRCHAGGTGPESPGLPEHVLGPTVPLRPMESCSYNMSPWWVEYTWGHTAHGGDSKRGWNGYSGAPGAVMECTDCHDAHGSYTPDHPAGNPYMIVDRVDGTAFVDDGTRKSGFNGPPWNTFGVAREVRIDVVVNSAGVGTVGWGGSTGLCSACHADWEAAYDWHTMCSACATCHAHGQTWGNNDFGPAPSDATPCP
ncbi:MAG: hypothetical protein EP329_11420 [Deltaproteobacteria bacterium]|nr:MAG: hypothetical protein EP329_11420 [Deltaproteobacteria bacterium]